MAGQKFEYDESGSTFFYFLLCFLGLVLFPSTYCYFIKSKEDETEKCDDSIHCSCPDCVRKQQIIKAREPGKNVKRRAIQLLIVVGWVAFALLVYRVQQFDYEYANFDPYDILGVSSGASKADIKKAYKKLSLTEHPDKGGDEKRFVKITKAYAALTDEISRRNWELYGNPDGPGVMNFGIALPSWIVKKENSVWVLGLYTLVFMVALPTAVGSWWYNSIKYSGDQVLLETTQLYLYFFHKTPHMMLRRVLMVLAASLEFEHGHNAEVASRPSDNYEVPLLLKRLTNLGESNKERPLCFEYSLKARCLLHAHLGRLPLPPATLELDRMLVVRKCPYLIQEMIGCVSQLVMLAHAGRISRLPSLDTIENVMKLSGMIVQSLWENKSPLLQLPHIDETMLRHFADKKKKINVKSPQQLAALSDDDRRHMLRHLSAQQVHDIEQVLLSMPHVQMTVTSEVLDDENSGEFTAGAITTVTVSLTRQKLAANIQLNSSASHSTSQTEADAVAAEGDAPADAAISNGSPGQSQNKDKTPVWMKNKKNKLKSGKRPAKKSAKSKSHKNQPDEIKSELTNSNRSPTVNSGAKPTTEAAGSDPSSSESGSDSENDNDGGSTTENDGSTAARRHTSRSADNDASDDAEWERCQARLGRRARTLDAVSRVSHSVHCPRYADSKHEYWWVYVCDRRNHGLVTAPLQVTDLRSQRQVELKFTAPRKPGLYTFTVCLRSDSYLGFDQSKDFKLDVKQAHEIPVEHPQWDISDDEDKNDDESDVDDFATDDDADFEGGGYGDSYDSDDD